MTLALLRCPFHVPAPARRPPGVGQHGVPFQFGITPLVLPPHPVSRERRRARKGAAYRSTGAASRPRKVPRAATVPAARCLPGVVRALGGLPFRPGRTPSPRTAPAG